MNTVSSQPPTKPQFSLPQSMPATPPQEREASYAPAPPAGSRIEGDRELTREYRNGLLSTADHRPDAKIHPIPPHSTFGQWWAQLHGAFQSPDVKQWIQDKGIAVGSIRLNPETGQISFSLQRSLDAKQTIHTLGQDDPHWRAISGPILQAARVLAAGHLDTTFAPPVSDIAEPVPYELVGRFYKERLDLTEPAMRKRADELAVTKTFTALDPTTDTSLIASRSESALQDQKSHLGDLVNRQQIVVELQHLAANADAGSIEDQLKTKRVNLASDSTYPAKTQASLRELLEDHGWDIPTTREELVNLAKSLSTPAPVAPATGNLGGALNWPVPLDQNSQQQLQADIRAGKFGDLALSPFGNVLDYLLNGRQISPEEQRDPRQLISELINSPRGKALGQAIQATFEARSVKGSATDWLLAALNVTSGRGVDDPAYSGTPGVIEGYRAVSADNMGKPPATVIQQLADHLVATGKASSPENAVIQAHVLLASQAPEFLVKDIPQQVLVGTHSWTSFTTAVARMEAKAPGSTAMASYAQVMLQADMAPVTETERAVEYAAQNEAIKQWGVANGMSYPVTQAAITAVREQFTAQVSELKAAAETHIPEMPTVEAIAQEQLKNAFPGMDPALFEQKNITLQPSNRHFPGPYSIRDLYIDGRALLGTPASADNWGKFGRTFVQVATLGAKEIEADGKPTAWVSSSSEIDVEKIVQTLKELPRPDTLFKEPFADFASAVKKTTAAHFKYLISKLPPEDRENLDHGKLTPLEDVRYPRTNQRDRVADGVLIFQTVRNGKATYYEFDRTKGSISKLPGKDYIQHGGIIYRPGQTGILVERAQREGEHSPGSLDEKTGTPTVQNSFGSARTQYIVDTLIADMNFPAVERYAKGATTFDTEVPVHEKVSKVALDLIPFYSAIKNFKSGNIGGGIFDLTFDIFGFAVGFGSAFAKGAKVIASTASALSKIGKVGRIIGRAAVGALNPLDGVDDLGRGALKLGRVATGAAYKGVKSLRGSYRSVNLLELSKRPDIAEGTYKAGNGASESKTLAEFDEATHKWYAYDPIKQRPYGPPLKNFTPTTLAGDGLINNNLSNWLAAKVAPNPKTPNLSEVFGETLERVKTNHSTGFTKGYSATGAEAKEGLEKIPGYFPSMGISDLKELTISAGRNSEQIGLLTKLIENRQAAKSLEDAGIFSNEITAAGGKATGMPQSLYLAQSDLASMGECAALANTMALAIQHGAQDVLIANFFKAASSAVTPASIAFRKQLSEMHKVLRSSFHGSQPVSQVPYTDIIDRLSNATTTTMLKISTQDHGLLAGVTIKNNIKEWFFFDPNFGLATFATEQAMRRGLETTLSSGRSASTLKPIAVTNGVPEFHVSTFSDGDFLTSVPYSNPFAFFNAPL